MAPIGHLFCTLLLLAAACAQPPARRRARSEARLESLSIVQSPLLRGMLDAEHVRGTIALWYDGQSTIACADAQLCSARVVPASTFKIANALIGLELGAIRDAEFTIPWDGIEREFAAWNRDHTLRSAIEASAVPYFQELARRVGRDRMARWVEELSYGNAQVGDRVDQFWLEGPLAISPVEQLEFLRRFATGALPLSTRSLEIVRDILVLERRESLLLRGKSGWGHPHQPGELGWFVAYVERPQPLRRAYVAVLLLPEPGRDQARFLSARRRLAEQALSAVGQW
jgi:beta-lactamase class D